MQNNVILDNRYELEQKIGEGGMAQVFRGRDRRLNRTVAIKVLHTIYANDPDFLDRFAHEAQVAASLSHPNIVNVYDVGQDGPTHYIVMEYVDGENLKTLINRDAPLPIARAVAIAEAIAHGLGAAHRFGLIHRDIKPQNIMVEPNGHVRITDFGIAKSHLSTARTQTGVTFGTADYISPEQARGEAVTARSDIYSLGVTLFEMLTGRLPFYGDNAVTVAMQHVGTPPPSPRAFNPQIPAQLEAIVLRTLAKDINQRPSNAEELARLLHAYQGWVGQETVLNPNLAYRVNEPVRVAPAMAASTGIPGNGSSTTGRTTIPPPRPAVVRAPRQQNPGCGIFVLGMLLLTGVLGLVLLFSSGTLDGLFSGGGGGSSPQAQSTPVPGITVTPTPTATPSATPTPTPALVQVPNIIGLSGDEARRLLTEAQLVPIENDPRYSETVPVNRVLEQGVAPDTDIEVGQSVNYTLSLGPQFISVPNLEQRRLDPARDEAIAAGFNVEVVEEASRTVSENFIIRQVPSAGARLVPGDTIQLTVSVGDKLRMPELTRRSEAEAKVILGQTDGLTWSSSDYQGRDRLPNFDTYFPGEVVSMAFANGQPIQGGQWIPHGSNIVLGVRAEE